MFIKAWEVTESSVLNSWVCSGLIGAVWTQSCSCQTHSQCGGNGGGWASAH